MVVLGRVPSNIVFSEDSPRIKVSARDTQNIVVLARNPQNKMVLVRGLRIYDGFSVSEAS